MTFSPDGRILAIGLLDSTVELWDTAIYQKIYSVRVIDSPYSPVYDLDFSPDGKLLAAGFEDGSVRIYGIK
jgi:WD40 repeat protein